MERAPTWEEIAHHYEAHARTACDIYNQGSSVNPQAIFLCLDEDGALGAVIGLDEKFVSEAHENEERLGLFQSLLDQTIRGEGQLARFFASQGKRPDLVLHISEAWLTMVGKEGQHAARTEAINVIVRTRDGSLYGAFCPVAEVDGKKRAEFKPMDRGMHAMRGSDLPTPETTKH